MSVSGIGTSCTYLYDATTGKLSTKDGTKNNFVDYFNGDSSEETLEDLIGCFVMDILGKMCKRMTQESMKSLQKLKIP